MKYEPSLSERAADAAQQALCRGEDPLFAAIRAAKSGAFYSGAIGLYRGVLASDRYNLGALYRERAQQVARGERRWGERDP